MNTLLSIIKVLLFLYIAICVLLYFFQEKLIFFPQKLARTFQFPFSEPFEEIIINTRDNIALNALLFKSDSSKGVIFYLHGNAGSLYGWGEVASLYTSLNYDVFMLDYRGYGKSEGQIENEKQFYQDVQAAYDKLKTVYEESRIIVLGYSIGTGPATYIASVNQPKLLILQAPYYSLTDMMRHYYPIIPTLILKYKFKTYQFLQKCKMPVVIFHGTRDEVIYYGSSLKLKALMKQTDRLITLNGQGHNGMSSNYEYVNEIKNILSR